MSGLSEAKEKTLQPDVSESRSGSPDQGRHVQGRPETNSLRDAEADFQTPVKRGAYLDIGSDRRNILTSATYDYMSDGIISLDPEGVITGVNPAFEQMFGLYAHDAVGKSFATEMIDRDGLHEFNDAVLDAIYKPNHVLTRDITVSNTSGRRHLSVKTNLLSLPGEGGDHHGLVAVVSDDTEKVRALRSQADFGRLLLMVIISLAVGMLATGAMFRNIDNVTSIMSTDNPFWIAISWSYLALISVPSLTYIHFSDLTLASIGVTLRNWRQALIESLGVCVVLAIPLVGLAYAVKGANGIPPFTVAKIVSLASLLYFLHSCVQELVARGVLQTTVGRLFPNQSRLLTVTIVAIVFSAFHAGWGMPLVLFTFFSSYLFGWLFERHGTLLSPALVHFLLGQGVFILELNKA